MRAILTPFQFIRHSLGENFLLTERYHSALICIDPVCYKHLKNTNPGKKLSGYTGEVFLLDNSKLLLGGFLGIGAPAAVAFTEELIACGIRRFVFLGTAGRLHEALQPGEAVICTAAISEEGTSRCYPDWKEETRPSSGLTENISASFKDTGMSLKPVKAWTTDAPYMETNLKLQHYLKLGAHVVEMEASALNAVAHFRKIEMAQVFVISDSLAGSVWVPYFRNELIQENLRLTAENLIIFLNK
jgi:uridine phosphorylase